LLKRLDLRSSDIFADVGAGKGRVLRLAAQHRMRQVVGVEYSSELAGSPGTMFVECDTRKRA
jgi:cyclopropane fatty-acyl-phospholipid synthase-like methyltransferase